MTFCVICPLCSDIDDCAVVLASPCATVPIQYVLSIGRASSGMMLAMRCCFPNIVVFFSKSRATGAPQAGSSHFASHYEPPHFMFFCQGRHHRAATLQCGDCGQQGGQAWSLECPCLKDDQDLQVDRNCVGVSQNRCIMGILKCLVCAWPPNKYQRVPPVLETPICLLSTMKRNTVPAF